MRCEGTYTVTVETEAEIQRTAGEASLALRVASVEIQRPANLSAQAYPPSIRLDAAKAKEINPP